MKILMTSGPTQEPLDSVRYLTNFSSGQTGAGLADIFIKKGHEVIFLYGESSKVPTEKCRTLKFRTFSDLDSSLRNILNEEALDMIIHLSAVGDYSIKEIKLGEKIYSGSTQEKIDSGEGDLTLFLKKNFKIISKLKSYAKLGAPKIIGFKLTDSTDKTIWSKAVQKLYSEAPLNFVVHNDLRDMDAKSNRHSFRIYDRNLNNLFCETTSVLANKLLEKMENPL